jgi:hypothetical protein
MKTDRLEDFIKNNREKFDDLEPSTKVWENISVSQHKTRVRHLSFYIVRVAAVLILALILTVVFYKNIVTPPEFANNSNDLQLMELIEAEAFYAYQVNGKLKEIRECYNTFPELKEEIEADLIELEQMYDVLKDDLMENISNKAVIEAMIDNNRTRLKLVDDILEQINC